MIALPPLADVAYFEKVLRVESDRVVYDHRVQGEALAPAALALEMVVAAARALGARGPLSLKGLALLSPVRVAAGDPAVVEIAVHPEASGWRVELAHAPESAAARAEAWRRWASCTVRPLDPATRPEPPPAPGAEAIGARPAEAYARLASVGLQYGPGFQTLAELRVGTETVFARLRAEAGLWGGLSWHLHPALVDGGLQALGALAASRAGAAEATWIPFSVGEARVYGALAAGATATARVRARAASLVGELAYEDAAGQIALELREIAFLKLPGAAPRAPEPTPPARREEDPALTAWLRRPVWSVAAARPARAEAGRWLVLGQDASGARALVEALGARGARAEALLIGDEPSAWTGRLLAHLREGSGPAGVVWLGDDGAGALDDPLLAVEVERRLERGLAGLLALSRALAEEGRPLELVAVSAGAWAIRGRGGRARPHAAAIWGFVRALRRELPRAGGRLVDVEAGALDRGAAAASLAAELLAASPEAEVALRGGERLVPSLAPFTPGGADPIALREGGVYVITGGTGGIGLVLARWMARARPGLRLALLARTPAPPPERWAEEAARLPEGDARRSTLEALAALRREGQEPLVLSCDLGREEEVGRALAEVRRRLGPIRGVVHAAGLVRDGLVRNQSPERMREVWAPKVLGALALGRHTAADPLDFLVLFGSLSGVAGNLGQTSYAAANAVLDAISWASDGRAPTICLDWGPWQDVGMLAGRATRSAETSLVRFVTPALGPELFALALRHPAPQWAVFQLTEQGARLAGPMFGLAAPASPAPTPAPAPPPASASPAELEKGLRRQLIASLSETLKLPEEHIDPRTNFMELGFDSIMAVQMKAGLEAKLGLTLPTTLLFERPTVNELVAHLVEREPAAVARMLGAEQAPAPTPSEPAPAPPPAASPTPDALWGQTLQTWAAAVSPAPAEAVEPAADGPVRDEDVAIVGLSCRFPLAPDAEAYWEILHRGVDCIREVPAERWRWQEWAAALATADRPAPPLAWGGFIDDPMSFDPGFFGLTAREAVLMDPQQRLFLEVVWEALERAGTTPGRLARGRTGVYVGASSFDHAQVVKRAGRFYEPHTGSGHALSIIANRTSYLFDWRGPSLTVDTACSSSLVALHLAVQDLRRGEVDHAVVGGAGLLFTPDGAIIFGRAGMLAADGRCKTFDAAADGYVRGEGIGALVLMPLRRALAERMPVVAVVKGTAVNHDGHSKIGLTAPNPKAQRALVEEAWAAAGIDPEQIGLLEAHGTGTSLGDPIELRGLCEAFGARTRRQGWCAIGSVKTNIGHLEPAAGVAGVIKAALALERRALPPTLHLRSPNRAILFEETPFYVNDRPRPWAAPAAGGPRVAAVSSFGFGGANAHVVLAEAPRAPRAARWEEERVVLTLSARTASGLRQQLARWHQHLSSAGSSEDIRDVAFTAAVGRVHHEHRWAASVADLPEALRLLARSQQVADPAGLLHEGVFAGRVGGPALRQWLSEQLGGLSAADAAWIAGLCGGDRFEALSGLLARAPRGVDREAALAALHVHGVDVDWEAVHRDRPRQRRCLPTTVFERQHLSVSAGPMQPGDGPPEAIAAPPRPAEPPPPAPTPAAAPPRPAPVEVLELAPAVLRERIQDRLLELLAKILETSPDAIDTQRGFVEMGVDSILAVEAVQTLQKRFGVEMPVTLLFDYPNVEALAGWLAEQPGASRWLSADEAEAPEPPPEAAPAPPAEAAPAEAAPASAHGLPPDARVPLLEHLGVHLVERSARALTLAMPAGEAARNHLGTVYAGAQFSLAEGTAALALLNAIDDPGVVPVLLGSSIRYTRPALHELRCAVALTEAETSALREALASAGEARHALTVPVRDRFDEVARVELEFLLRRRRAKGEPESRPLPPPTPPVAPAPRAPPAVAAAGSTHAPLAIIGMAGRFPQAEDLDAFWRNLAGARDCIREIPADRWPVDEFYDPNPDALGKMVTRWGGFVDGIDHFDPAFFGVSPNEARAMDPQQRLMLEVAWRALEQAGYGADTPSRARTGVFVGVSSLEYALARFLGDARLITPHVGLGNSFSIVANRLSYAFNLRGPSLVLDTACSSSLVALNLAAQSLARGDCEMALVGGVHALVSPDTYVFFSKAGFMSPRGRCRTFDGGADGYVRGEGAGAVLIKPLEAAERDGDTIHAVLRATAFNQDGRTNGLTAPNRKAQEEVLRAAWGRAGIGPASLSLLEAHGTGTELGDPIEVDALTTVFREETARRQFCAIGSVKSNIGHLEPAAGMASLFKVVLALQHQQLPPTLHVEAPNRWINFEDSPFYVNDRLRPWPRDAEPRRAGISGFGFGGTNAHVVVEEAPARPATPESGELPTVLALSARTEETAREQARNLASWLREHPEQALADVAATLATGRRALPCRVAVVGRDRAALAACLEAVGRGEHPRGAHVGAGRQRPRLAFLFTGQGSQRPGMGRRLWERAPAFRAEIERCAAVLDPLLGRSLVDLLREGSAAELADTRYTQPTLVALSLGLAAFWRQRGVLPDAVLGHSVGTYGAAIVSGMLSLEDGLRLIAERARLMAALPPGGKMAAVLAPAEGVGPELERFAGRLGLAASNAPDRVVISGEGAALDAALEALAARGVQAVPLSVSHAFHSPLMEPAVAPLRAAAAAVTARSPRLLFASDLHGRVLKSGEALGPEDWARHIVSPVRFGEAIRALHAAGVRAFLELGPRPTLAELGRAALADQPDARFAHSLSPGAREDDAAEDALGALWAWGVPVDPAALHAPGPRRRVPLPPTPLERQSFWMPYSRLHRGEAAPAPAAPPPAPPAPPAEDAALPLTSFVEVV